MYSSFLPDQIGIDAGAFQTVELAAKHGYGGVDLRINKVADELDGQADRFADALQKHSLRAGYCSLTPGKINVADDEWNAAMHDLPHFAQLARDCGFTRAAAVVLPFSEVLPPEQNRDLHVARVNEVMQVLDRHGIRFGLEYVSPKTRRAGQPHEFVHELSGLMDLAAACDSPNVGVMLDSFHWHCAGETKADIEKLTNWNVVVVHVNDAIKGRPTDEQIVTERELPGETGVIDLETFFAGLKSIGYDGPVTCEPTNAKFKEADDKDAIAGRMSEAIARYL